MTTTIDRPTAEGDVSTDEPVEVFREDTGGEAPPVPPTTGDPDDGPVDVPIRPLLVAASSTLAASLMTGGMFGSWFARVFCVFAGLGGVGWAWLSLRAGKRRSIFANAFPLVLVVASLLTLAVGAKGGPSNIGTLVRQAAEAANALKPPVPFDAGWRPILLVVLGLMGFAAAWLAALQERPQLGFAIPIPLLALTAINQPKDGQLVSGLLGLLPLIAGLAVVFGGGSAATGAKLDRAFELKRAARSLAAVIPALLAIFLLNQTSFLFPAPAYDPNNKPQKPKPQALSATEDRVLFEVSGDLTGPWKLGVFDVYDGKSWLIQPPKPKEQLKVSGDASFGTVREGTIPVQLTVRDLGSNASVPGVVGPSTYSGPPGTTLSYDKRSGVLRVPAGRAPAGLTYTLTLPKYPGIGELRQSPVYTGGLDKDVLTVPPAPPAVDALLADAPSNPWDRLNTLLKAITDVEVAVGEGIPGDFTPDRVQQILVGNHEGSPYDLVAARALLARWAGVPSRIGFGFDGTNDEAGVKTVRPKNAAQWLEVYFDGIGWIPINNPPKRAKADLNNEDAKTDPTIEAGADVGVEVYIPVRQDTFQQLYEKLRALLVLCSPILVLLLGLYLGTPAAKRAYRRTKRRRWADARGPTEQIAVAYAELRDLTTDLGVGDPYATPLEFLDHLAEDEEHEELAWLVSRALYGDMAGTAGPDEATAAHELSESLQRRLRRGQPLQSRVIGVLSRSSLLEPYTDEVPSIRTLPRLEARRRLGLLLARRPRPVRALLARVRDARVERRRRQVRMAGRS
jgi:hypothetical protein